MKKKIIIGVIVFLILALGVGSYFVFFNKDDKNKSSNKDEKITITFDADGGTKVEDMKVKKGSSFQLPETKKEGYMFIGWYNGSVIYTDDDTASIKKDIVLTAKWEALIDVPEEVTELKVVFDSKGGSKVKDMTFKCTKEVATIKNLPKSKKDSYEFLSWEDKNGKSILDGASIICDGTELKLYAVWEYDGPTANPEQKPEDSVGYKCEQGTLKDDKCIITKDATLGCDIQHEKEISGKCYSVRDYKATVCRVQVGMTGTGSSLRPILEEGSLYKEGNTFVCYKEKVTTCDADHKIMGICYKYVERKGSSFNPCADAGSQYVYIIGNQLYGTVEKGTGASTGCYIPKDKHYVCESGYDLDGSKCTKTVSATKLQ